MKLLSIFFLLVLIFLPKQIFSQDSLYVERADTLIALKRNDTITPELPDSNKIVIVFAGDIMGHDTQITGAYIDSSKTYDYEPTFRYIRDYITSADIAVGNLEVTLAGPPFRGYPQFSSPDELAVAAKNAGFDVFVTANNHALDRGVAGMHRTIRVLDSLNFIHAGIYRNPEERSIRYPIIIESKGIRLALLNYTYGTNGLKVPAPNIVNRIDTAQMRKDILKAKMASPDYILCAIHWGAEYEREENKKQRQLARFMLDQGVDGIIGSHPHVVQPIKLENCTSSDSIKKCPVVYSLGNFVSNQRARYKDGGIMVEIHLSKNDTSVAFDSIAYLPYWVYREKITEEKHIFYVVPVKKYENNSTTLNFNENDLWRFNRFKSDTRTHLKAAKESDFYNLTTE